jgi:hypothetical protein
MRSYVFMDQSTYEETRLPRDNEWAAFLKEGATCELLFYNGKVSTFALLHAAFASLRHTALVAQSLAANPEAWSDTATSGAAAVSTLAAHACMSCVAAGAQRGPARVC